MPTWLTEIEGPRPLAELERHVAAPVAEADPRRQTVEALVHEQPERVAQQLRAWISEDATP